MTEDDVKNAARLAVQAIGAVLWRNNVGALPDERGVPVRYGLANDSKAINEVFKSSDLVGIAPGGVFMAIECKGGDWKWGGTKREKAQAAFIEYVRARGGRAGFIRDPAMAVTIALGLGLGEPFPTGGQHGR